MKFRLLLFIVKVLARLNIFELLLTQQNFKKQVIDLLSQGELLM